MRNGDAHTAAHVAQNGTTPSPSSWAAVDLTRVLDGGVTDKPPSLLARSDGPCLLYRGQVHSVIGEPEGCKGWLALTACREQAAAGEGVVYIDFETDAATIKGRLLALGLAEAHVLDHFSYVRPEEPLTEDNWSALAPTLLGEPTLIVLDGVTVAFAQQALNLQDNNDVARWFELVPRRLARGGAAVLMIDHVVKDREQRGRYAIGAQHKLAGVDVSYAVRVTEPFGRGRDGLVKVTVIKDRHGYVREHALDNRIADLRLRSLPGGTVESELAPPGATGAGTVRPVDLMEAISRALEAEDGLTKRAIRAGISGHDPAKDRALGLLVAEGFVEVRLDGRAHRHRSVKPYRADDGTVQSAGESPAPDDSPVARTLALVAESNR